MGITANMIELYWQALQGASADVSSNISGETIGIVLPLDF